MGSVTIRKYMSRDRSRVRQIAWDTAFIGRPASAFFEDQEVLKDFLTFYFTDHEPGSCFVAESGTEVIGYLLGCIDSGKLDRVSALSIFPRFLIKMIARNTFFRLKNIRCGWHMLISFFKKELVSPDFSRKYPATMHINIKEGFRRSGVGSRLMTAYLAYLKEHNVPGVRLATYSPVAGEFFKKAGFELLFKRRRTYFRYILKSDVTVYIYAKKLGDNLENRGTLPRSVP
jgi:GNAT superfamily N-acetyltransferase